MPTCQNCGEDWTWSQTIKTLFINMKTKCPHCGVRQYESVSSRKKGSIIGILIPPFPIFLSIWLDFSVSTSVIFAILLGLLILGLYPFILKLSNEQEPFW